MLYQARGVIIGRSLQLDSASKPYSVILLQRNAPENAAICAQFIARLDPVANKVPDDFVSDGAVVKTRPVFWLWNGDMAPAQKPGDPPPACTQLLAHYDYGRADILRQRVQHDLLLQAGQIHSFIFVAQATRGSTIDLCIAPLKGDLRKVFAGFVDYFAQETGRCDPQQVTYPSFGASFEIYCDYIAGPQLHVVIDGVNIIRKAWKGSDDQDHN